jgi:hypothetical protein
MRKDSPHDFTLITKTGVRQTSGNWGSAIEGSQIQPGTRYQQRRHKDEIDRRTEFSASLKNLEHFMNCSIASSAMKRQRLSLIISAVQ